MSEYIAPGDYLEEIPAGATPIDGVPTSTTGFVGRMAAPVGIAELSSAAAAAALLDAMSASSMLPDALHLYFANGGERAWVAGVTTLDVASVAAALARLAAHTEVALTAVPEAATLPAGEHEAVARVQLADAARLRRFALIDAPLGGGSVAAHRLRAQLDSSFGAIYWPALCIGDAPFRVVPASAAVCGVYARVDRKRGVFSQPTKESVIGLSGLADTPTPTELAAVEAAGINTLRMQPGSAPCTWSARTLSSSPELRYVAVRRHLLMLQNALSRGTRWAVFEPNDRHLWSELRTRIGEFLRWQFLDGALKGVAASEAFYVRCDESTTTADDRAAGIAVCEVGVALVRASEFIVFRVAQSTARAQQ